MLVSNHPFRKETRPLADWQREAIRTLEKQRQSPAEELTWHEFTHDDGRPVLRFAAGQVMKQSCVKCHNRHPQSPKKDWTEGDLTGALAIKRPLDRNVGRTRYGLGSAFFLMGTTIVLFVGLALVLQRGARARWRR